MPETVKLLWLRLIHFGSHHYNNKRDARYNVIGNLLLLVFIQTCLMVLIPDCRHYLLLHQHP